MEVAARGGSLRLVCSGEQTRALCAAVDHVAKSGVPPAICAHRDPTAFESLASHLPRWPPTASSAPASSRASPSHTRSSSTTLHGKVVSDLLEEEVEGGLSALDAGAEEERDAERAGGKGKGRVSWSSWDKLDSENGEDAPR